MLAYAAHRRRLAERNSAPHAMLVILVVHIAAIAAVMSAKMDLPEKFRETVTRIELIPPDEPPPPEPQPSPQPRPAELPLSSAPPLVPTPPLDNPVLPIPQPLPLPDPGPVVGADPQPGGGQPIAPREIVRSGPRFATPPGAVRPPYPPSKIRSEEEAVLRLRLSIDERGRVVAVDPVGRADPAFLAAARKHLIAKWRYQPATEDGRPIASSTVITLRFQLEG